MAALAAGPVLAEAPGCYQRGYSEAHLAKFPEQTVEWLLLSFRPKDGGGREAMIMVEFAETARTKAAGLPGKRFDTVLSCEAGGGYGDWADPGAETCYDTCDGGFLQIVSESDEALVIRTQGVLFPDPEVDCGSSAIMADEDPEGGYVVTTYRLDGDPESECGG